MGLFPRGNDALNVNPSTVNGGTADITITVRGSDWYWVRFRDTAGLDDISFWNTDHDLRPFVLS